MKAKDLKKLVIVDAVVRQSDIGYILASGPVKEQNDQSSILTIKWSAGNFQEGNGGVFIRIA